MNYCYSSALLNRNVSFFSTNVINVQYMPLAYVLHIKVFSFGMEYSERKLGKKNGEINYEIYNLYDCEE